MYDRAMRRIAFVLVLTACSTPTTSPMDAGVDAADDVYSPPRPDAWISPTFDTGSTWLAAPLACPAGPAHRASRALGAQRHFALGIMHWNIQYVAGGLAGFQIGNHQPFPDWTDDRVQDAIITQSLEPVLALLDAHPSWTFSLEMQGYMIEVMLARHRATAQHLSDLVRSGQVELVSFHYSDQLFLAYPRSHMQQSLALNTSVLGDGCLAASGPVFTQEGQWGEGMADLLGTANDTVLMLPKNLFSHEHGDGDAAPYYTTHGVPVVIAGRGVTDTASGFTSVWTYMDDAEKLATNGSDPYAGPQFLLDPSAMAAYEQQLMTLESQGYAIAGVGDWVASLQAAGVTPTPLPPTLDGTWQPSSTGNLDRWMGDTGGFASSERDNGVVAGNSAAGRMTLAAQTALGAATSAGHALPTAEQDLARAWRDLLLGEVSDATGWNPIPGETYYGMFHGSAAAMRAHGVAIAAGTALGMSAPFYVDTAAGTVIAASAVTPPMLIADPSPPFVATLGTQRTGTMQWQLVAGESDHHVLTVSMMPSSGLAQITMPWTLDHVRYTPALLDGTSVDYPMTNFVFTATGIPIDDGPFGLATDQWLILDTATVALAARLDPTLHTVMFRDVSLPPTDAATWVFHVITGTQDRALLVADRLNLHPLVRIDP
jgi:hypothetical protein